MTRCNETVQDIVRGMLRTGLVEEVLAFGRDEDGTDIIPLFITDQQDVERIITTSYYPCSLAQLIAKRGDNDKKFGVVVRSCDARSMVELAKRYQVNLENLYLIGIECYGIVKTTDRSHEVYGMPEQR